MINYIERLQNNPEYFKQFSCKEILFLNYDCPVKEKKLSKWSEHNYFYYVLSGKKVIHVPGRSWDLTKGSVVFVKRGACIVEQFFREPFCIVVFVLPDSFISRFITENKELLPRIKPVISDNYVIPVSTDELLTSFYESVLPYFATSETPPGKLIELKFNELLLHIATNPDNQELISHMYSIALDKIANLESVMEANFPYNLSLDDYARLCNRSLSAFKRDFRLVYNTTPGKWLLNKRLEYARILLMTTDKSLADVIFECGFENHAHFSKSFKLKFASSPLQYRKQVGAQAA